MDRDLDSPLLDMDDATKVATGADGAIQRIGKTLDRYDAIDTGLFRATPALAEALRAAVAAGGSGCRKACSGSPTQGRARDVDVTGLRWLDVDDPRRFGQGRAPSTGSAA